MCGAVTRPTGPRSASKASDATSPAMSVASEQRGFDSSTTTRCPVLRTEPMMVSRSSGESVRGSMTSARDALLGQPLGRLERRVDHLLDAHDGHVAALAHDLGHAEGDGVGLLGHRRLAHVQPLVLDEDDRVGIADGLDEQALGVVRGRRRHDLQAGHVRVQRVERLASARRRRGSRHPATVRTTMGMEHLPP